MGRIRSIKPEFVQSESIGRLSRDARLLFIQLWTIVDDEGRARAASRMLASLLYPYDDDVPNLIDGWLVELERAGHIRLYVANGSRYLDIPNWLEHQKIDRPSRSKLPEYSVEAREPSRALAADHDPLPDPGTDPILQESKEEEVVVARARARPACRLPEEWSPSDNDLTFAGTLLANTQQIIDETDKFRDYWHARAGPGAVKRDWSATWRTWCRKAVEINGARHGNYRQGGRSGGNAITAAIDRRILDFERAARGDGEARESPAGLV